MNNKNDTSSIRLNKYLSESGICSRREADKLIEAGKITIDDTVAKMGTKVMPGQVVKMGKKTVSPKNQLIILALNKPKGIVCTEEKKEKNNIIRFLNYKDRITYIGRLDKDSQGLLLLTNNGDIINKMMRAGNYHEKEYKVIVNREITPQFVESMSKGVPILDTVTRPCNVEKIGKYKFRIVLTQGLNRQIRRMCEYLGYKVEELERTRIMNIHLKDIKPGSYRELTKVEIKELMELIKDSSKETVVWKD